MSYLIEKADTSAACPNTEGMGVWWARNLYSTLKPMDTLEFTKWCSLPQPIVAIVDNALQKEHETRLSPNPGHNELVIDFGKTILTGSITILSTQGIVLHELKVTNASKAIIDSHNFPSGILFVKISAASSTEVLRWIKQ